MIDWNMVTSIATAVGVFLAAWQLWESRKLTQSSFEDSFDEKYRHLAYSIPVDALLSKKVKNENKQVAREWIYNYLDLCNEQIYLRMKGRITYDRWIEWSKGIQQNLKRPFFKEVLKEVEKDSLETFTYLERLLQENYKNDPAKW